MYKNIIFDFYGTLVDIKTTESSEDVWKKLSLYMGYKGAIYGPKELKETYKLTYNKLLSRYGSAHSEADISDVFYKLYAGKGVKAKAKLVNSTAMFFRALTTDYIYTYEGVEAMLKGLKDKKMNLYLLSNGQRLYIMPELKMLGLKNYFDGIHISSDYHMGKPDKDLFKQVMAQENLKKSETIMVGNEFSTDIKGANAVGIDSLYFLSETSDRKAKKEAATFTIVDGQHKKIINVLTKK